MALTPGSWMLGTVLVFLLGSNIKAIEIPKECKSGFHFLYVIPSFHQHPVFFLPFCFGSLPGSLLILFSALLLLTVCDPSLG
ncbi:hypothetical protein FKM82_005665 [Ascaphus truei]